MKKCKKCEKNPVCELHGALCEDCSYAEELEADEKMKKKLGMK